MKRNFDLIRHILLIVEENDDDDLYIEDFLNDEYSPEQISYHLRLLLDVDYIEANSAKMIGSRYEQFVVHRMTMFGHEYIDSIRDPNIWAETKSKLSKVSSSVSLDIVKSVAGGIILKMLGM